MKKKIRLNVTFAAIAGSDVAIKTTTKNQQICCILGIEIEIEKKKKQKKTNEPKQTIHEKSLNICLNY